MSSNVRNFHKCLKMSTNVQNRSKTAKYLGQGFLGILSSFAQAKILIFTCRWLSCTARLGSSIRVRRCPCICCRPTWSSFCISTCWRYRCPCSLLDSLARQKPRDFLESKVLFKRFDGFNFYLAGPSCTRDRLNRTRTPQKSLFTDWESSKKDNQKIRF